MNCSKCIVALAYFVAAVACAMTVWAQAGAQEEQQMTTDDQNVLFFEDFSEGMDNWWAEGGLRVWVEDQRLHVDAEPGGERRERRPGLCATVWCKQQFVGDVKIECDAHVLRSDCDVNNINFFVHFSDPSDTPLYDTRADRPEAAYGKYHVLNGNIITFLSDTREAAMKLPPEERLARVRIRHCPGFELLNETYTSNCRKNRTYHIEILKQGGKLSFSVDGELLLTAEDPEPHAAGLFGLRTFRTHLWWDNIKVSALE